MANSSPLLHQGFQGLPLLNTPLIDERGNVSIPWYRFFVTLWTKTGQGMLRTPDTVVLQSSGGATQPVGAQVGQTGSFIGNVMISGPQTTDPIVLETLSLVPPADVDVEIESGGDVDAGAREALMLGPPAEPQPDPLLAVLTNPPQDV